MTQPFFDSPVEIDQLREEVASWVGTPYRHWCGVKGLGCDCIHFVARVFESQGGGPYKIPWYPKDWHLHLGRELLMEGILANSKAVEVPISEVKNGDIVLYRFGRASSHSAIYLDNHVYSAITRARLEGIHWDDVFLKHRIFKVFRVMK
jgi:cell wall-associated NlpC family hydrolase